MTGARGRALFLTNYKKFQSNCFGTLSNFSDLFYAFVILTA
ncbi:hypothetical protein AB996_0307 [Lactococcus cremoris]|uniref:Uncharacterized protein n=1 Tax=Lactococcus lactis subsp. cremoris TaxID=1359 RepID=A0A166KIF6_LACLC|nr:hypothetical protein AB996_0307 [Lactococcus cremoris]